MGDVHHGSPPRDGTVRYGSHISLKHIITGRFLSSRRSNYSSGSGQQEVFGNRWTIGHDEYWIVIPAHGEHRNAGDPVPYGSTIRLKHKATRCNLHSHDITSPVSHQQEVSCFGNDHETDENDNWVVQRHSYTSHHDDHGHWRVDDIISLRHKTSRKTLHSHEIMLNSEHQEVTCFGEGNEENDKWRVALE